MLKKYVVCDTMIWYDIANGKIDLNSLKNVSLVATGINVLEMCSSENLYKKPQEIKNAIIAMHNNHGLLIEYAPIDYLLFHHVNKDYNSKSRPNIINSLDDLQYIMQGNLNLGLISTSDKSFLENGIINFNKPYVEYVNNLNLLLIEMRSKIINLDGDRYNFKKYLRNNTKKFSEEILLEIFSNELKLQIKQILPFVNWEEFEFFNEMLNLYLLEKLKSRDAKFHLNDIFDLFNMAYVGKNDLYWTIEINPWLRIMNSNAVTKKFVFNLT